MGGVEATFQFLSYKIDDLQLEMSKTIGALLFNAPLGQDQVTLQLRFRNPLLAKKDRLYVGGMEGLLNIYNSSEHSENNKVANIRIGIAGVFKVVGDDLAPELEEKLVKIQIPAILFPYLRSALSTITTSAGIAGVVLPLINVHELAKKSEIKINELG